jgi:hypothetical protein
MIAELLRLAGARTAFPGFHGSSRSPGRALAVRPCPGRRIAMQPRPRGNAVTHWNAVAIDAFKPLGTNPMGQSDRHPARRDSRRSTRSTAAGRTRPDSQTHTARRSTPPSPRRGTTSWHKCPNRRRWWKEYHTHSPHSGARPRPVESPSARHPPQLTCFDAVAMARAGGGAGLCSSIQPRDYQFTPPFNFAALPGWGRVKPFVELREHQVDGPDRLSRPSTHATSRS